LFGSCTRKRKPKTDLSLQLPDGFVSGKMEELVLLAAVNARSYNQDSD